MPRPDRQCLVIGGEKDTVCLPSEQQSLADYYGVACHIIEDAPHNLMSQTKWQEAADKLAEWLVKFAPEDALRRSCDSPLTLSDRSFV